MMEREERLVEGLHAVLRGARSDGVAYERGLLLADDVVAYEAGRNHDLDRRHAPRAFVRAHESLRDDCLQNPRELYAHGLLQMRREGTDDSPHRLCRVERVESRENE